jgi:zinc protease
MLALLAVLCVPARAQELKFEEYKLDNGLTVILHQDHSLPQVVVNTWYEVGSKDEVAGRSGFAHLFEHLMFMGTTRLPGSGIDETMEGHGGWNNAFTFEDATNYYDVGPSGLLDVLLWIEADRMEQLGQAMTQEKLDLQRDVVRNERRQNTEDQPYARIELVYPGAMYPAGHPYSHPVIGSHEDLQAASLQDVKDFFAQWYVPNNAILVVAGDFDPATVKDAIAKDFGHIPSKTLPDRQPPAPVTGSVTPDTSVPDRVDTPQLDLYWHTPGTYQPGDAEMTLVASLLGGGESSRLYQKLVLGGLCQDLSVYQYSLQYGSAFQIQATAMQGVPIAKIEAVIDDELAELAAHPPSATEMERLHNGIEYSTLSGLQSLQTRALQLAQYTAYTGTPDYLAKDLERYRKVTAADLTAQTKQWLVDGTATRIVVVPQEAK